MPPGTRRTARLNFCSIGTARSLEIPAQLHSTNTGPKNCAKRSRKKWSLRKRERSWEDCRCGKPRKSCLIRSAACSAKIPKRRATLSCCKLSKARSRSWRRNWVPIPKNGPGDGCITSRSSTRLARCRKRNALFDRGPIPRPGDGSTVDATYFGGTSFDQLAGASYREIFDLSDWDNAVAVNVPGQSGQPGSEHYDDLLALWTTGRYFPLSYTKPAVDRETTDVLELTP